MISLKDSLKIRKERNARLEATSLYSNADIYDDMPQLHKDELKAYKKALRDIPQDQFVLTEVTSYDDIQWPEKPHWMTGCVNTACAEHNLGE
jgi:hypothetical protein